MEDANSTCHPGQNPTGPFAVSTGAAGFAKTFTLTGFDNGLKHPLALAYFTV